MKIATKILLMLAISLFIIIGLLSWFNIRVMKETMSEEIEDLLISHLEFAAKAISQNARETKRTAEIIAHNPAISKALDLDVSVGTSGLLNELVKIYPFCNYILVVTPQGDVFAVNTNDKDGNKMAGEELLGSSVLGTPAFLYLLEHETFVPELAKDPLLPQFGIKPKLSQWYVKPVLKGSRIIGYVVISYDWQEELLSLLKSIRKDLLSQENPVIEVALVDNQGNVILGSDHKQKKLVPSSDLVWREKPLKFGNTTTNLVIASDRAKINEPVKGAIISSLAIAGVATIILLVCFYVIIRKTLLFKLQAICEGTDAFKQGDLTFRLPSLGNDELGSLASTFNIMGESLQKAAQELELKVQQRTEELRVTNENLIDEIAQRKKAQETIRESEQTLNRILTASPVGIAFLNADRNLRWANRRLLDLFGYDDAEQLKGLRVDLFYASAEEFERVGSLISQFCPKGEPAVTDTTYVRKNGETFEAHLRINPFDLSDMTKGFVSTIEDISEKKRAERELWDSEARFQAFMDNSPMVAFIKDEQGRYVYANKEWRLQFAPFVNDWKGKTAEEFLPRETAKRFVETDRLTVEWGEASEFIQLVADAEGSQHSWLTYKFPILDSAGKEYLGGIALDISERLRAEEKREKLKNQLFQSQKLESLGTLVGGIAHDFNNMLQVMIGYSDILLLETEKGEPGYKELQMIIETGKGGAELVKKLLAFAQKGRILSVPLDLNCEISQLASLISRTLPNVVQVDVELTDGPTTIRGDSSQIAQVLMNLAINASEAIVNRGSLKIATMTVSLDDEFCKTHYGTKPGNYIMVTVTDSGRGMDKETLSRIFDPFFSTKARGATRGTGLGLSVAQGIVQQLGGCITCQSEIGKGTEFRVYFPAIEAFLATEKSAALSVLSTETETILVAEDNIPVAELERKGLENAGYKVILANNGKQALEIYKARSKEISLVILDLLMPEMSGEDCLMELLKIDPSVGVLIASGYAPEDDLHKQVRPLVRGFVRKPFAMSELVNEVSHAIANI